MPAEEVMPGAEAWPAEAMPSVDRAWLEMDMDKSPMVISAILDLEGVGDLEVLQREILSRLMRHPRFAQQIDDSRRPSAWRRARDFEPAQHIGIRHVTERELPAAVADEMRRGLDRERPLWHVTLFPVGERRVTVLFRAHHAMGDGVGFIQLLLGLHDDVEAPPPPLPALPRRGPLAPLIERLQDVDASLLRLRGFLARSGEDPLGVLSQTVALGRDAATLVALLARGGERPQQFSAALSGHRAVAWSHELPTTAAIKRAAHALGCTHNDLMLTALAGAFAHYLHSECREDIAPEQELRIAIPVNLRKCSDAMLSNRFGLGLLDLPVGIRDPHKRLAVVVERTRRLKNSREAHAVFIGLAVAGELPGRVERNLVGLIARKACAVVSNLPGPEQSLHFAGARIANIVFWPPQSGGIGIGVSLLSYAGRSTLGISSDVAVLRSPRVLLDAFVGELEALLHEAAPARHTTRTTTRPRARRAKA
ncbi:WS/DGAT domain-containing protein [Solimonas variicoloris]|uniref:WS/DGAT domain-containing protein n=1 Tax=Solimonas variicoloris TaxID=254408 RepID=UPI0003A0E809|nr:WS/DGAT domain-containing protein [Solimonas variicoloris]